MERHLEQQEMEARMLDQLTKLVQRLLAQKVIHLTQSLGTYKQEGPWGAEMKAREEMRKE